MGNFRRDIQFGLRLLWKSPGFASVAVLALALGIGANTAIFTVIYASLIAPMPFPHAEQLVWVWSKIQGNNNVVSAGDFLDWRRQNTVFQDMEAWTYSSFNLATGGRVEEVTGSEVTPTSPNDMIGYHFALGRDFLPEEGEPGHDHVVILSNRIWRQRFGSDPKIIGKQIHLNGEPYTVVGVWASAMLDNFIDEVSVPLVFKPEQKNHDFHFLSVMGRLKPGVSVKQAQADMDVVAHRIAEANPKSNMGWGANLVLYQRQMSPSAETAALLLMTLVGFVLLIACANVANLLLARGMSRQKEVAVRAALGATRAQLFAQFLAESLALAALGGTLGIGVGWAILKIFVAVMPAGTLPAEAEVGLNFHVLLFTIGVTLVAGVLFGCVPAWQATRLNLSSALKEGGRSTAGAGRHRLRSALVVMEFALALTALAGAGLAIHSVWNLEHVELGVRTDHVLTFSLPVPNTRFSKPDQITPFYRQILAKIEAIPGVYSATVSLGMPIAGAELGMPFTIVGKPVADPSARPSAAFEMVTPGYFETFGIQIEKGRGFSEQDIAGSPRVAIVSEDFVKRFFSHTDPLTQGLMVEQLIPGVTGLGPAVDWQIVGVARDVTAGNPRNQAFPLIYVPFWQSPWPQAQMAVHAGVDPAGLRKGIEAAVQSIDPDLPLADVNTMHQIVAQSLSGDNFQAQLFAAFAALALLLAASGIYGVMAFSVAQRTHEIGLRMALGADRASVFRLILKESMILAVVGLAIGLGGAYAVARTMKSLLYGVGSIDPVAFSAVALVLLLAAVIAGYVPARRATQVDPMIALRQE